MVQTVDILPRRRAPLRELVVGVDGGGTRTRAVVLNGTRILGEGTGGPSNPLRVGIANGATAIREAVDKACAEALIHRDDLVAAGVGLAGVRRKDIRARMRDVLIETLGIKNIELVSDGDIALYGATDGQPGVVVISGTGSISVGINRQGKRVHDNPSCSSNGCTRRGGSQPTRTRVHSTQQSTTLRSRPQSRA